MMKSTRSTWGLPLLALHPVNAPVAMAGERPDGIKTRNMVCRIHSGGDVARFHDARQPLCADKRNFRNATGSRQEIKR